jgi:hypothetical protein
MPRSIGSLVAWRVLAMDGLRLCGRRNVVDCINFLSELHPTHGAGRRGRRRRDDHGEKCRSKNLGHWVAPLALSSIEEKLNDSIATSWLEITKSYPMCPQEERSLLEARH